MIFIVDYNYEIYFFFNKKKTFQSCEEKTI